MERTRLEDRWRNVRELSRRNTGFLSGRWGGEAIGHSPQSPKAPLFSPLRALSPHSLTFMLIYLDMNFPRWKVTSFDSGRFIVSLPWSFPLFIFWMLDHLDSCCIPSPLPPSFHVNIFLLLIYFWTISLSLSSKCFYWIFKNETFNFVDAHVRNNIGISYLPFPFFSRCNILQNHRTIVQSGYWHGCS